MSKKYKPIIIVAGEPESTFLEIYIKALKYKNFKSPLILICSLNLLKKEINRLKFKKKIKILEPKNLYNIKLDNNNINLINISIDNKKNKSNYINISFNLAFNLLKEKFTNKFINGPINKKDFLQKKFLGITEFISEKFNKKKTAMLIYNKDLSVCPITTHLPLKFVTKKINKSLIFEKTKLLNDFYINQNGFKPKIAITGLNPHCESVSKYNEDNKIISPAIKNLKRKGYKVDGPFPADTVFLKQNRVKYDVILGMYHDQVLTPFKTLKEYDAINITLGLPFFRLSPDHGPNKQMFKKNLSNPLSLIRAIEFLDKR